jgi:parvulin-like peptidyl-prolyl isomerase
MRPSRAPAALVLMLLLALFVAACGGGDDKKKDNSTTQAGEPPKPMLAPGSIAVVDQTQITQDQFNRLLEQAKVAAKQSQQPFPKEGTADYLLLKKEAVEFLVDNERYRQKAESMGVKVDDKAVDDRFKQIIEVQFGGNKKEAQKQFKDLGLTETDVKDGIRRQLIFEALYDKVTKPITVNEADIRKDYDENKVRYEVPETRDVRHILVKSKAKAEEIRQQIENGGDFAALAKQYSTDPGSKDQGGLIPAVGQGQMVPEFDKAVFSQPVGEVSQPVKTSFGWHIIKVVKVTPKSTTPFNKVKDSIKSALEQTRKTEAFRTFENDLKKEFEPKIVYAEGFDPKKLEEEAKAMQASTAATGAGTGTGATPPPPPAPATTSTGPEGEGGTAPSSTTQEPPPSSTEGGDEAPTSTENK